jgi:hypothetical protein
MENVEFKAWSMLFFSSMLLSSMEKVELKVKFNVVVNARMELNALNLINM